MSRRGFCWQEMLAQLLLDGYSELSGRRLTAQEAKGFARLRGRAPWELRRLPFGRWLASMEGSGQLLRYLPALEQCYDTVAQVQQTYTVGGKLDPLLYKDLGILEPHRCGLASRVGRHAPGCSSKSGSSVWLWSPERRRRAGGPCG